LVALLTIVIVLGVAVSAATVAATARKLLWVCRPEEPAHAPVSVILPLSGSARGLGRLVRSLAGQTLRPRRLIITVESTADPAFSGAMRVRAREHTLKDGISVEVVVAGTATSGGQKGHNEQAALKRIDHGDEIIAFADAEIRPHRTWLSGLVAPILYEDFDVVSAHRWRQVSAHRLGAHLLAAIDRQIAFAPRLDNQRTRALWSGSLAITADAATYMNLRGCLSATLSDDVAIADGVAAAGLRSVTRSMLLVAAPLDLGLFAAWRLAREEYQVVKLYRPWLWLTGLVSVGMRLAAWVAAVILLCGGLGAPWPLAGGGALLLLAALGFARQFAVGMVADTVNLPDPPGVRFIQLLLGAAQPLEDLFQLSVILGSSVTRRVRIGRFTYQLRRGVIRVTSAERHAR